MKSDETILEIVKKYINEYEYKKNALPGHNGKYEMEESPVRNTAHWLISFAVYYEIFQEEKCLEIIRRFADYLCQEVRSTKSGAVYCLLSENAFNRTNGLIGQAWVIEGLVKASYILRERKYWEASVKIFKSQNYDPRYHLWNCVDINGEILGEDVAFNHNLWFAMAGFLIIDLKMESRIEKEVFDFISNINSHLMIYKNGLISHYIVNSRNRFRDVRFKIKKRICEINGKGIPGIAPYQVEYERAYHLFSAYAFARIYQLRPQIEFFETLKFKKIISYALNVSNYIEFYKMDDFAYGYNSPAFEYPLVCYVFSHGDYDENAILKLMKIQYDKSFDKDNKEYSKCEVDAITLNARIYEYMQYIEAKNIIVSPDNKECNNGQ